MTSTESNSNHEAINLEVLAMTSDIVAAHVANNNVDINDLPRLIKQVHSVLAELSGKGGLRADRPEPAVPVKKSIHDDYIICLEDGKKLKMLKRHLKTAYNMTPEQYRERWGLSSDYPMVAPNYAKQRSHLAVKIGLGRKRKDSRAMAA
ncbi:MucR family transcriptional regulator [Candidatus Nucleicultrix amoebiphila]|jgi:predicted transcriptional regulator|uniref:MucR family transcriptional regulator n=1 Tax=Candidatus Nucleicultrix amoebiphila FS5 TaxID=1414854 RepID=A0A1W6N3W2_9PROT|nr:MucR family transcriptional regulator [Candidatus Nucleicultrix amoebiphila]ARN84512.1 MucR family transcriptional regulator [Candidatus Nucleicultrix amoebiphila FS5]